LVFFKVWEGVGAKLETKPKRGLPKKNQAHNIEESRKNQGVEFIAGELIDLLFPGEPAIKEGEKRERDNYISIRGEGTELPQGVWGLPEKKNPLEIGNKAIETVSRGSLKVSPGVSSTRCERKKKSHREKKGRRITSKRIPFTET